MYTPLSAYIYTVSLLNSYRLAKSLNTVGWMNPTLYASNATSLFNDITIGTDNYCSSQTSAGAYACASGFSAAAGRVTYIPTHPVLPISTTHNSDLFTLTRCIGWDPVTGLGSIHFTKLGTVFNESIVYNAPVTSPTSSILSSILTTTYIAIIASVGGCLILSLCLWSCFTRHRKQQGPQVQQQQQQQRQVRKSYVPSQQQRQLGSSGDLNDIYGQNEAAREFAIRNFLDALHISGPGRHTQNR